MYDNYADAVAVVTDLEAATDLTPSRQISMIATETPTGVIRRSIPRERRPRQKQDRARASVR